MTATAQTFLPPTTTTTRYWDEVVLDLPDHKVKMTLVSDGEALTGAYFGRPRSFAGAAGKWINSPKTLVAAAHQLEEYAAGELAGFDLPLRPRGTHFQLAVWEALSHIPYGTTTTYGRVAHDIGHPAGSRAVGAAVGANPLGIVIPCHRVIGANGSLTGFGGGLDTKVSLLRLEGVTAL
jgi:methylated-DNA-[protein]-cysteine S-methyltransferase